MKVLKSSGLSANRISFLLLLLLLSMTAHAQVAINTDGSSPDGSAMLDVKSYSAGMLIPRLTMAQRNAISNPATGLMIYQTDNLAGFYHYDGSAWKTVGSGVFAIDDLSDGRASTGSVFLGNGAGDNDDGTNNNSTAVGQGALLSNISAMWNTAIGTNALRMSTGLANTACGGASLRYSTTGTHNVSIGTNAMYYNTTGAFNVCLGNGTSFYNELGSKNTIIGYEAGHGSAKHNKSGNIFLGYNAGFYETGDNKLYIENSNSSSPLIYGEFDNNLIKINGDLEVTGAFTGIAIDDLSDAKTDVSSVFLGASAGKNDDGTDNSNTAVGSNALYANTIGVSNTAIGTSALRYSTESNFNTACGAKALMSNSTGEYNTALGYTASRFNTTGSRNVSIGDYANQNNETGSNNTIVGYQAGGVTSLHNKSGNVFLGYSAGFNETGDNKLYIENSNSATPLIYGDFSSNILAVNGKLGIDTHTPDVKLHVVGGTDATLASGGYLVTGLTTGLNIVMDENEMMARNNGAISSLHLQRSGGAFYLHYNLTETNQFMVATDGKTGIGENIPTAKLHINTITGEDGLRVQIEGATKLKVASNGGVAVGYNPTTPTFALQLQNSAIDLQGRGLAYSWTTYSDGRLKTEQKVLEYGLKEVMQLQPKSYYHHNSVTNEDGTVNLFGSQKTFTIGFIAQELNQVVPEAVYEPEDETKNLWGVDYVKLIPVLTRAIQEQQHEIEALQTENTNFRNQDSRIKNLEQENAELKAQLDNLEKRLKN